MEQTSKNSTVSLPRILVAVPAHSKGIPLVGNTYRMSWILNSPLQFV
jgi:hypothetical protein